MPQLSEATKFIAAQSFDVPAAEVVKRAKTAGVKLVNAARVHVVRSAMRKKQGTRAPTRRKRGNSAEHAAAQLVLHSAGRGKLSDEELHRVVITAGTERVQRVLERLQAQLRQAVQS